MMKLLNLPVATQEAILSGEPVSERGLRGHHYSVDSLPAASRTRRRGSLWPCVWGGGTKSFQSYWHSQEADFPDGLIVSIKLSATHASRLRRD